jgi:hypothetical protein
LTAPLTMKIRAIFRTVSMPLWGTIVNENVPL